MTSSWFSPLPSPPAPMRPTLLQSCVSPPETSLSMCQANRAISGAALTELPSPRWRRRRSASTSSLLMAPPSRLLASLLALLLTTRRRHTDLRLRFLARPPLWQVLPQLQAPPPARLRLLPCPSALSAGPRAGPREPRTVRKRREVPATLPRRAHTRRRCPTQRPAASPAPPALPAHRRRS